MSSDKADDRHSPLADYGKLVGQSTVMLEVYQFLKQISGQNASTILVTGESGTGKDLVAQTIHMESPRKTGLFVEIDCAALPEQLIESELFGHEKGAFTDAQKTKQGLFEIAKGGTIFLDEIAEMTLATQGKLLRALENRHFRRVGGLADLELDACVIAATNQNLVQKVTDKQFREELFFRLNIIPIVMPSLRDRKDDIPLLLKHFIKHFNLQFNRHFLGISKDVEKTLMDYRWPGNVRELKNLIERIMILGADQNTITMNMLPMEFQPSASHPNVISETSGSFILPKEGIHLKTLEENLIKQALERTGGNQTQAAKLLGISRFALRNRLLKNKP